MILGYKGGLEAEKTHDSVCIILCGWEKNVNNKGKGKK